MAGWSFLKNGLTSDSAENANKYQNCSFNRYIDHVVNDAVVGEDTDDYDDDYEVKLFDRVLSLFLNEAQNKGCIRPIPVMFGDGQSLDLFKLFWLVRKRGGFDLVNGFWAFVAKELGLVPKASASLKLIYFKYLYEFELWLSSTRRRLGYGECQNGENFSSLTVELETGFRKLLSRGVDGKRKEDKLFLLNDKKNGKYIGTAVGKSGSGLPHTKDEQCVCNGSRNGKSDDDKKFLTEGKGNSNKGDADFLILDPHTGNNLCYSRKRKREPLSKMLNWMIQIAKSADDPSIGLLPPVSKWKDHSGKELWVQALRARDSLVQRTSVDPNAQHFALQNNRKVHPSMYEDVCLQSNQFIDMHCQDGLTCSGQLPALSKPRLCSCCNSFIALQTKVTSTHEMEFEHCPAELAFAADVSADVSPAANTLISTSTEENFCGRVRVGRRFQAEVPEWKSMISVSDIKWLGTNVYPLKHQDYNAKTEKGPVGKGRPDTCSCSLPGSVECFRFHIAEKRMKLKLELGPVFFLWRFDQMGEEVSLRWSAIEEKNFKDMVQFNPPSLGKCFWNDASKYFPRKATEDLVSYYFNVFLIRRRSYQNRVTPNDIDSDDDDSEFGSVGYDYGHEAVNVPGANTLLCSENKQSTDFR